MSRHPSHDKPASVPSHETATRKQIRGSTLLLVGRCLALVINLAVQVVTVRYLAKDDYGAFAFGLTMVALGTNLSILGLTKSLSRFVPIYHERGEAERMAGAIVLMLGTVLGLGVAMVVLVYGLQSVIAAHVTSDSLSLSLLLLLIVLVPVDSLDRLLESLFAVFGNVRSIFIRRHLMGPGLKLAAVLGVVLLGGNVRLLAGFYLAAGVIGILFYMLLLWQVLKRENLLQYFRPRAWEMPAGEIFRFSLPLFSSQIGFIVKTSLAVLLLEMLHGSSDVAELRAVFPFARLNEVVFVSFGFLFTPLASRMFARDETREIDHLYWRTSVWIVVFTLPAFLVTFVLARPFTVFLLGERYAAASTLLMILAVGFFVEAVMGFNVHTLRVFARVRQIVAIDLVTIGLTLGLCIALIPTQGAWGAAVAISTGTVAHKVLCQAAMRLSTGVGRMHWRYARFYGCVVLSIAGLGLVEWWWRPHFFVGLALASTIYALLLYSHRSLMDLDETFPELLRVPILGRLLAASDEPKLATVPRGGS